MSKELKNITDNVMNQIKEGKLKMRPKIYFIIGAVLTFVGLIISVATSIFIISLIRFSSRSFGPMGGFRIQHMISNFPWWMSALAILGLIIGIVLIRKYNFSYKIDFKLMVVLFVLAIIISGWVIDIIGVNDILSRRGPMKGIMKESFLKYNVDKNIRPDGFSKPNSFPRR